MDIPVSAKHSYPPASVAPRAEFADRIARLRKEMAEASVDAVVVTSQENFEYFSSYRTMAWAAPVRPVFLVIGRSECVIVAPRADEPLLSARYTEWDARHYDGFMPEAVEAIVGLCQSLGAKSTRLDYGREFYGMGTLGLIDGLGSLGEVREAGDLIWNVRVITSEYELELMRATFDIVNRSFDDVVKFVRVGHSEIDVMNALQVELIKNGADRVDPFSVLFGKGAFQFHRPSSNLRLEKGHYIWTDFRSRYGGYPADRNRTARVGRPSSAERDAYSAVRGVTVDLCKGITAGSTGADAYALFVKLWSATGLPQSWSVRGASRVGHGGGIGFTEPPSISAASAEVIKPGMVLHLEPKLQTEDGVFQCEEIVYVGENGNEFLSELSPEEIPIVEC